MIKIIFRALFRLFLALKKINVLQAYKQYDKKSGLIVLMYNPGKYLLSELSLDLILLSCIIKTKRNYRILFRKNAAGIFKQTIFLNLSDKYNESSAPNYVAALLEFVKQLERQGNRVFYSSWEIQFWENKARMHELFDELKIHTPETKLFPLSSHIPLNSFDYPLLVKDEHSSGSRGVYKINTSIELQRLVENAVFLKKNRVLIVQELLRMHKDLRVIMVKDKIVLHYWRFNPDKEWKPTSTKHGTNVDFETFPEKWRNYIIETFERLKLTTGAFDIAWQDDDLETLPYILEVSPSYDPNPPVDLTGTNLTYGEFKNKIRLNKSYDTLYINTVASIKEKYVNTCLSEKA